MTDTTVAVNLDHTDRELLNLLQQDFPLVREPFRTLAAKLEISEAAILNRIRSMHDAGLIRSIGGVFDPLAIGYRSTLVAFHVPGTHIDEAAKIVSRHPGVSHNYARNHYFNLWFTLSLPSEERTDWVISSLAKQASVEEYVNLPAVRVFKLRVYFDMVGDAEEPVDSQSNKHGNGGRTVLSTEDKKVIALLCHDLPLLERPFDTLARAAGLTPDEFLGHISKLHADGTMRRFTATLRHQRAGFSANAMSCWIVPPDQIETAGEKACLRHEVSHCYERKTAPQWPYNLFAMIHGKTQQGCEDVARAISQETSIVDYALLYSIKEYKKQKIKYFDWLL